MCLSIPAKVISINEEMARVSIGGTECDVSLQLIDDVKVGDYILMHTGFAIQKINKKDARETLSLFKELGEINDRIDEEENRKKSSLD